MDTSVHLITYEESLSMPENRFEEILDGESRIMPPPTPWHFVLVHTLFEMLVPMLPGCRVCPSGLGIAIRRSPFRYRIPDLTVFDARTFTEALYGNRADPYIWRTPILIAECLSPSNRRGRVAELMADYAFIGVPELWLFYSEKRRFEAYVLESGTYQLKPTELSARIDLDKLWRAFYGHGQE